MVNTNFGCLAHSSISFRKCKCGLISHSYLERESDSPSFQRLYQACHSRICSLCPTNASLLQFSSLHFSPVVFLSFVLSIIIVSGLLSKAVIRSYHLEYYYKSVHIPTSTHKSHWKWPVCCLQDDWSFREIIWASWTLIVSG